MVVTALADRAQLQRYPAGMYWWQDDSFNNDTFVETVASHEHWGADERERFARLRAEINSHGHVDEAFLIVRGDGDTLVERAIAVGSWPWWRSAPLSASETPILDALNALAVELRHRL